MNGILLGLALLASSTGASATLDPPHAALAPAMVRFELPPTVSRDRTGHLRESFVLQRDRQTARSAKPRRANRSRVDRIIALAAGASIGWVVGGAAGYAVTPKRGPYDDTSGLKGVVIGAPIGGVVGALIGYRLMK